ncbi:MAG: NAD(P)/FAD-dependent oxidoreductase [Pseudomonadota bacterium]
MPNENKKRTVAIIGGGASGIFASIRIADLAKSLKKPITVEVFEASPSLLKKVKISGGGRCNVTHNQFEIRALTSSYPRGEKELMSPFQRFQPQDTLDWFASRGVKIKAEQDGRMFPVTDSSQTIIDCFLGEAKKLGVKIHTSTPVRAVKKEKERFVLTMKTAQDFSCDHVLLATGSSMIGYKLAEQLGHKITELAPSLFTFKIQHPLLAELSGTSFATSKLKLKIPGEKSFEQVGPLLITHWGLSGPALLKLSALAAREMKRQNYNAILTVCWLGEFSEDEVRNMWDLHSRENSKSHIGNVPLGSLTKRFWKSVLSFCEIPQDKKVSELSKKEKNRLIACLHHVDLPVTGKSRFKEEFVECGGVDLREVDFKTMQSRVCESLYLTGELLDVDGITGGFNFQHAWTSAWIAGEAIVSD